MSGVDFVIDPRQEGWTFGVAVYLASVVGYDPFLTWVCAADQIRSSILALLRGGEKSVGNVWEQCAPIRVVFDATV